jgi:hypothetical protein
MKTTHLLLAAVLGLGAGGAVFAADAPATDSRVQVNFSHPDKFTDIRDSYAATDKGEAANLDSIRSYLQDKAAGYLPDGDKLEITFTDIDLAGDFEPWRRPGMDDVRIVKDIYPPRMDLSYKITDASGKVVKQGKRQLRDLAFMSKLSIRRDDPLRYEKDMLDDWLRDDIKPGLAKN